MAGGGHKVRSGVTSSPAPVAPVGERSRRRARPITTDCVGSLGTTTQPRWSSPVPQEQLDKIWVWGRIAPKETLNRGEFQFNLISMSGLLYDVSQVLL